MLLYKLFENEISELIHNETMFSYQVKIFMLHIGMNQF